MRSSQGKKCFVMIHFILLKLSNTVLLLNTLIHKYMWDKITVSLAKFVIIHFYQLRFINFDRLVAP